MATATSFGARLYTGEKSFDFIGTRKRWYAISLVLIAISIGTLLTQGLKLGIEFQGGSSYTVNKTTATVEEAR